ncbi:hypothetical protein [Rhizobium mongolense]
MTVFFTWLLRTIGIGGVAFLGLYIYDWGIPGASRIPYLSSIPILGDLTTGRAHSYAADQVRLATSQMVTKFERDALASQLAAERRLHAEANLAAAEARTRAEATQKAKETADAEVERLKAEAAKDPELSKPNARDRLWLEQH